ncbi:glycosyltransferase [Candidatus Microgenomates bacterium]|nr:glycosyltransferase [Candidatus Microgenomates bacterium]
MLKLKKLPLVSVIITTRNSATTLSALLESIRKQTYPKIEIILVDNKSTDRTTEIAREYTRKVYNKGPERSAQRNFGVKQASGKYILILDSDMRLTKLVVEQCVNKLEKSPLIGALVIPEKSFGEGFWTKVKVYEREFYLGESDIEAARFFRTNIFRKSGGYDLSITGPEDWDLPLRMKKDGVKISRIKSFILHNEGRFSITRSAKKKFYYASHALSYLQRHPEMISSQGNLLFRPVFFRKWRKLISHPVLAFGLLLMRSVEMTGALLGLIASILYSKKH